MQKKWAFWVPAAAVLVGALVWFNWPAQSDMPTGVTAGNGRLELARLDVATLYPGRVERVLVEEGQTVTKDTVLAELSAAQSSSRLAEAQAAQQRAREAVARADAEITARRQQQRVAQMEADNARRMHAEALVSAAELERRQAALRGAAAAVQAAQAARAEAVAAVAQVGAQVEAAEAADGDMQIRAPKDGRVEYRIAEPGNVLGAGSRVVTLLDPGEVSMALFLPAPVVSGLKVGDEARIVLDGLDAVWPATVRFIASEAQFTPKHVETEDERNKMVYRVKLVLPEDVARRHDRLLKGGLTGVGYVRHNGTQGWPAELAVRLPN